MTIDRNGGSPSPNALVAVDELVVAIDQLAYAFTRGYSTQTVHATDTESKESKRDIFTFTQAESEWKISRYMFNKAE